MSYEPLNIYINNNLQHYLSETPPCINNQTYVNNTNQVIADSGTTGHYVTKEAPLLNAKPTTPGPTVILPDNTTITATHEGMLDLPALPTKARIAHVFPTLGKSLLSIASICDAGGTAIFSKKEVTIHIDEK